MPIWLKTHKPIDSKDPGPHLRQDAMQNASLKFLNLKL